MAGEVEKRKDEVKSLNYDVLAAQKNNLLEEKKKKNEDIDGLNKEISDFKSKHPDGSVRPFEDEIKAKEGKIADINSKLDALNARLKDAAAAFGNLSTARANLREQFATVLKELSNAKSSPATYLGATFRDEDKKTFENAISVIVDQINSQVGEHKKQEDGAKGTQAQFEQLILKKEV